MVIIDSLPAFAVCLNASCIIDAAFEESAKKSQLRIILLRNLGRYVVFPAVFQVTHDARTNFTSKGSSICVSGMLRHELPSYQNSITSFSSQVFGYIEVSALEALGTP